MHTHNILLAMVVFSWAAGCDSIFMDSETLAADWKDFPRKLPQIPPDEKPLDRRTTWKDEKGETW